MMGWFGCLAAGCAAVLSLLASAPDDGLPDDAGCVQDSRPAAFTADADGTGDSAMHHGDRWTTPGYGRSWSSWAFDALSDGRVGGGPPNNFHGRNSSALPDAELSRFTFGGVTGPVPIAAAGGEFPQGEPLSFAMQPDGSDTGFFLVPTGPFGGFPPGAPGQTTGNGPTDSGNETGYFLVGNPGDGGDGFIWFVGGGEAVPEPSSWALGLLAFGAVIYLRRRRSTPPPTATRSCRLKFLSPDPDSLFG